VQRRPRHVGLNALFLEPGQSAGAETYLRGLAPALAKEFPATRFTIVTTRRGSAALKHDGWPEFCTVVGLPCDGGQPARRLAAGQLRLPVLARLKRWDVLHSLASLAPVRTATPAVITVHDVALFHLGTVKRLSTPAMRMLIHAAGRRADAVIALTQTARDDVAAALDIPANRIHVVHNGAGRPRRFAPALEDEVRARYELKPGRRVVLCVAAMRPRENQELLVRALRMLGDDVLLVLCGHPERYADQLEKVAEELGVASRLRIAGYVGEAELEALWRIAGCAAFPALAEGFGLAILEAMQRGVPVACADTPALRELGGLVPRYFDPHDVAAAARTLQAALTEPHDVAAGTAQAGRFTWEESARGTFAAYERALATTSDSERRRP
jgi:glycosyltransferase involved in cell wall biosynthesis